MEATTELYKLLQESAYDDDQGGYSAPQFGELVERLDSDSELWKRIVDEILMFEGIPLELNPTPKTEYNRALRNVLEKAAFGDARGGYSAASLGEYVQNLDSDSEPWKQLVAEIISLEDSVNADGKGPVLYIA